MIVDSFNVKKCTGAGYRLAFLITVVCIFQSKLFQCIFAGPFVLNESYSFDPSQLLNFKTIKVEVMILVASVTYSNYCIALGEHFIKEASTYPEICSL